jgi:TPR repeat
MPVGHESICAFHVEGTGMTEGPDVLMVSPGTPGGGGLQAGMQNGRLDAVNGHDNPEVLFLMAMLALKDGRAEAAVELFKRAIALDVSKADYHYGLGTAFRAAGQMDRVPGCYR